VESVVRSLPRRHGMTEQRTIYLFVID